MTQDKNAMTPYDRFYELALKVTFRQDQATGAWADHARTMAEELCEKSGVAGAAGTLAAPPVQGPAMVPQGVPGSRFGPAFTGWDDTCLQQILFGAQQYCLGVEAGGTPEQLEAVQQQIMQAVHALGAAHQARAAAARAAQG